MIARFSLISILILPAVLLQTQSCQSHHDEPVPFHHDEAVQFGPGRKTDLVFFFKKSASQRDIEHFLLRDGLVIPEKNGTGFYDPEGMAAGFSISEHGFEGYGLNFKSDATADQREAIKLRITRSPLVYKVYEDVVPSAIDDL